MRENLRSTSGCHRYLVALALTKPGQLHHYITTDLAAVEAITALETAPVLHTLKTVR